MLRRFTLLTFSSPGVTRKSTCIAPLVAGNGRGVSASARQPCRHALPNDVPTGQTFKGGAAAALMRIGLLAGCNSKTTPGETRVKSANSALDTCFALGLPLQDAIRPTLAPHSAAIPMLTLRFNLGSTI